MADVSLVVVVSLIVAPKVKVAAPEEGEEEEAPEGTGPRRNGAVGDER